MDNIQNFMEKIPTLLEERLSKPTGGRVVKGLTLIGSSTDASLEL